MTKKDRNFDDLARKFDSNIYGTSKGRLRHELLLHYLDEYVLGDKPLRILDTGGGTGEMTKSLLDRGHQLTINDLSEASLQLAKEKCSDYPQTQYFHASINTLPKKEKYDLVLCHAVVEWVSDVDELLRDLKALMKPNGYLSLSFYNKDAQIFSNAVYGNLHFVLSGMKKRNQVRLTPHSPASPKDIISKLKGLPLDIVHQAGIRCFHDYLRDKNVANEMYDELLALELRYGAQEPYMWLGKYFHILAKG